MDFNKLITRSAVALVMVILLAACSGNNRKIDKETFEKTVRQHEVQKVSDADLFEVAKQRGSLITEQAGQTLMQAVKSNFEEGGTAQAIPYCQLQASPITDSLATYFHASIRRVSDKYRNPENQPNAIESEILEAYKFNKESGLDLEENIQELEDGKKLLYTKPILIPNAFCLNCHGRKGIEISEETEQLLKNNYPQDQATGYQVGELRGMWSITLETKQLILSMD